MQIACPACATSYEISDASLGAGRSVRCTRCRTVWFATAPEPALEMAETADFVTEAEPQSELPPEPQPDAPAETQFQEAEAGLDDMAAAMAAQAAETGIDPAAMQIDDAPPLAPHYEHRFAPGEGPFPMTGGDPANFERRRASKRAKDTFSWRALLSRIHWPLAPLPTTLLALGATVAVLVGWRADFVRLLPQTASFYSMIGLGVNLRGLEFENIKTVREIHDGIPVMVVEGDIVSVSRKPVDIPRLRFGVRNGLGAEIYTWTAMPSRAIANPGDRVPFRSRLASPPAETHDITVRFYNRRDSIASARDQK